MKITKAELERRFEEYNKQYFDGKLGPCEMKTTRRTDLYGEFKPREKKNGTTKYEIYITTQAMWDDISIKDCILHEMAHFYVYSCLGVKKEGVFNHGKNFRRTVKQLRKKYGVQISAYCYDYPPIKGHPSPKLWERVLSWLIDR